ncbi:YraN family protein [Candidatus Peregrinibacteria bacterium]|nr:MAG: YraN family protein [Candidatus Peregrinibacteria bacterium]
MPTVRRQFGDRGEQIAEHFLLQKGYVLLERNFLVRRGEIDLIFESPERVLVFVEVKTRSSTAFGTPAEGISFAKAQHLVSAAYAYLEKHQLGERDFRIDLVSVLFPGPQIEHIPNILEGIS